MPEELTDLDRAIRAVQSSGWSVLKIIPTGDGGFYAWSVPTANGGRIPRTLIVRFRDGAAYWMLPEAMARPA